MTLPMRILGLDPGLRTTGWGVIDVQGSNLSHVDHGIVTSKDQETLSSRLHSLYIQLTEIILHYNPHEAAVEETFVNKNPLSALKLGAARGVVLLAPAQAGLTVGEYSANKVKKSVVGVGHADKAQVAMMVGRLLPKSRGVTNDAADALAVAICHAHHRSFHQKIKAMS
ncbi:MAG: crossover junction endodeoxyribonuclease RuvC [Proteobacteria bacterium]|nr:crossover junction endodeoxyribonuclease RuvC [Pseudomonadota bacterium]